MEQWNKIINSNVVKMFRNIAYDWWGLDVHFYDKFGNDVNNGLYFRNPLCSLINSKKETAEECLQFRTHTIKELNGSQGTFLCKNYDNLKGISVPITVKGGPCWLSGVFWNAISNN